MPPAPKKKAKVERTRFRESTHTFRQKSGAGAAAPAADESAEPATTAAATPASTKKSKKGEEKPGKKEKIRYGQAPRETLPTAATNSSTENAGALPETAANTEQPVNPLEPTAPTKKTRFSARAREAKKPKGSGAPGDALAPAPPDAAEVADRQTQSAPLEPNTTSKKKKKSSETNAEKTRLSQQKKTDNGPKPVQQPTPIPPVPGAPAPAQEAPAPQSSQQPQQ